MPEIEVINCIKEDLMHLMYKDISETITLIRNPI